MAARGSILKQEITQKILDAFPGSFLYNDGKEIRINGMEDGTPIQIKVALTAAKTAVESDSVVVLASNPEDAPVVISNEKIPNEPTEEEKERLAKLLKALNLT